MQFGKIGKIITAGALATVMATSTMAFASTLADYPAPFVATDGTVPSIVVVGGNAAVSDVVGAIDMAARLGAEPSETKTITCAGGASGAAVSVTGGVQFTSDLNKTYLTSAFSNGIKNTVTSSDLPALLATGTFTDMNNTQITYSQQLAFNGSSGVYVTYGTQPTGATEPVLNAKLGNGATYEAKVFFMGGLDTSAINSNYKITLFGKEYTFGDNSTLSNSSLTLYSSAGAQTLVLAAGEKKSVSVGGSTYEFELKGYGGSSDNIAYLYVNGQPTSTYGWNEGSTYTVGTTKVFVSDVSVVKTNVNEASASVKLFVGTDKLVLTDAQSVVKNDNALVNTLVTIGAAGSKINSLTIRSAPDTDTYVTESASFVDPVFGSFKLVIGGMSNPVKGDSRDVVTIAKDGTNKVKLTFTNKDGTVYTTDVFSNSGSAFTQTYDSTHKFVTNESDSSDTSSPYLINPGDIFVMTKASNKATYIYKYVSIYTGSTPYMTFQDITTGANTKVYYSTDPYIRLGENAFKVTNTTASNISVDLNGDDSTIGADGTAIAGMYAKGEELIKLGAYGATTADISVTETPLYSLGGNEPAGQTLNISAAYSSNDISFSASTSYGAQVGSSNTYKYLSPYGTYMETNSDSDTVTIYYPGNRPSYPVVALGENPVVTVGGTTGTTGTSTYKAVKPITTSIAKLDSEVTSADKTAKNLILVGGPCVNDLVAELATAGKLNMAGEALTCAAWNAKSTAGDTFGLIQVIDDAFATGKAALVVAGSTAADTRAATSALQDYANKGLTGAAVKIKDNVITPVTVG